MDQWQIWLVPLIAMAVWILGSLMRGGMEERQRQQGRPNANNGPDRARPAPPRPANDLESFLREVHRRRQTAEPPPEPERVESRPKPRPAPPPRRQPRPAPPPATRRPEPRRNVDEPVAVEVVRIQEPQPPAVLPVLPPVAIPMAAEVVMPLAAVPPPPRPAGRRPAPSLAGLLDSPAALRKAILLREIFDPPLCKRRR